LAEIAVQGQERHLELALLVAKKMLELTLKRWQQGTQACVARVAWVQECVKNAGPQLTVCTQAA